MKRIIIIISTLTVIVLGVTIFYFRSLSFSENNTERVFHVMPANTALIFEYKNEASFYDIFKDFGLFSDILGKESMDHLRALKSVFIDDATLNGLLSENELFFSLHGTVTDRADFMIVTPVNGKLIKNQKQLIDLVKSKYVIEEKGNILVLNFSNSSRFYFSFINNLIVGSFNENLLKEAITPDTRKEKHFSILKKSTSSLRNKSSIANLYVNFKNFGKLLNNFSDKKNPIETTGLKNFSAVSSLNINYQSNAFMFSGTTELDGNKKGYAALFLNQNPGRNSLADILPYDAASYTFYYLSDLNKFKEGLDQLITARKENDKKNTQIKNVASKHSINIEKEIPQEIGNEFGIVQLASRDKLGLIKSARNGRLSFIFSTISSSTDNPNIRKFNDSDILYYFLGDPFKEFKRPFYAVLDNYIVVANNIISLNSFIKNYETQNFLSRTDKNIYFQQYLSNQGNIFYFIHNGNSKGNIRTFLSKSAYKNMMSDNFDWSSIYGLSIQFSADKDKFFTNLYMGKIPATIEKPIASTELDSLLR